MKQVIKIAVLALILAAGQAWADPDDGVNSFGVYFEPDCETNCADVLVAVPFHLYFMLANNSQDSIGGFQFRFYFDPVIVPGPFVLAVVLPPNAWNSGNNSNFIVDLGVPSPTSNCMVLVDLQLMVLAPVASGTCIMLCPSTPSSLPGVPAFNDGEDVSLILPMTYSTYNPEGGWDVDASGCICAATFGCPAPVPVESRVLGDVKALFR
jgi:hypothetical protein